MKDIMKGVQTEVDASYLYQLLASKEDDPVVAKVFAEMSQIEKSHAVSFLRHHQIEQLPFPGPSWRARLLATIGKVFGYDYILGVLLDTEKSLSNSAIQARKRTQTRTSLSDTAHVKILVYIMNDEERN